MKKIISAVLLLCVTFALNARGNPDVNNPDIKNYVFVNAPGTPDLIIPKNSEFTLDTRAGGWMHMDSESDYFVVKNSFDNPYIEEHLATQTPTPCAARAFANALRLTADTVAESDPEYVIQGWIHNAFQTPDTLKTVLNCPEIANIPDEDTIVFQPIEYTFPAGRHIVINYETQPKILRQKMLVANKRSLPETDPSPRIGAPNDPAVWTNTEPAWYGILVVQSGSLDEFVGPDKNYTLSLKHLEENIDRFYPRGNKCTSKSALASDSDIINVATRKTVGLKDAGERDSNDYYVAGDANLQWITWGQVAIDVAITVITVGGGTLVLGATKGVRASKAAKGLVGTIKNLEKVDKVQDYIKLTQRSARAADELKTIDKVTDAARYAAKSDEIADIGRGLRALDDVDDVKKYKNAVSSFQDVMKYRRALRGLKIPQRGNVIARGWRAMRAASTGNKTINKGAKIARAGMKSGRARDWLFHSTLKNAGALARVERAGGLMYGAIKFVGNMYDWSETSTGDFTNGIEFKPLGLLSADDLQGQENVVNHGMWLMWAGDSMDPADDDAAYLQSLDFAEKFHQDLIETQEEKGHHCDVDIYVVRPILRNPGEPDAQLYYLIMNDVPWTSKE